MPTSSPTQPERVLVTGIGVVSPIGTSKESFWAACLEGRSGASRIESPWIADTDLSTKFACTVRDFDAVGAGLSARLVPMLDRTSVFAMAAGQEALADAGFELVPDPDDRDRLRIGGVASDRLGVVIGSGIGGLSTFERSHAAWHTHRSKQRIKRYALPMLIPNAPAGQVAIRFGAGAECKALSTACAASTMAIGDAWHILRRGEADVMLAGGAEGFALDEDGYGVMGFDRLRVLSTRNDEPERASRPFDRERDGFVLGEGAAILVLEREGHARARGARGYAAITGYAANCDSGSFLQLEETGRSILTLAQAALTRAALSSEDVGWVSAHGTSTVHNDRTESRAMSALFGSRDVLITALKSMTGHCIGASGALETAAAALSFCHGVLTPTINYDHPDPECAVRVVANRPQPAVPGAALKLSYGFGGHNACLVMTSA